MGRTVKRAVFQFKPFSKKQKKVLAWWFPESPVSNMDGIIADGFHSIRENSFNGSFFCDMGHGNLRGAEFCHVRQDHRFFPSKCSARS